MWKCLLALSAFFFAAQSFALTLEEAVALSLASNDRLKQSFAGTEAAYYKNLAAFAPFLPGFGADYAHSDTKLKGLPPLSPSSQEQSNLQLTLSYNLFNGFGDLNNLRLASKNKLSQELNYSAARHDTILTTKTNYLDFLKARDQLEVAKQTLELLEAQKRIAEISFEVGTLAKSDVLRVDVQLASTRLQLLNAQISLKLARQQLENQIGRTIPEEEGVAGVALESDYEIPSLEELQKLLEINRSELASAELAYESAGLAKKAGASGFLPSLSAFYRMEWLGDKYNPMGGRDQSYDSANTVGISATWNLFKGLYDVNTYLANSKNEQAASYALQDLRKALRLQVRSTYETYFSAKEMLNVAEVGVEQAKESYRVMQNMFENSEATTTDLLDANLALNNALMNYSAASYNLIAAIAQIERAVETQILVMKTTEEPSINMRFKEPSADKPAPLPVPAGKQATVKGDVLNVRAEPSRTGAKLGSVYQGERFEALEENEEWVRIEFNGGAGWLFKEYVIVR